MTAARWGLVALVGLGLVAALVVARELRRQPSRPVEWRAGGGELGRRVRAGKVPGVEHLSFRSASIGEEIGLVVADPHDYAPEGGRAWPVVYFLNGFGSNEWGLYGDARGLVEDLRNVAFVVTVNQGHSAAYDDAETMISREAVAFVDGRRATVAGPSGRALAGHSLGGMGALYVGTRHPDIFGSIGAISSACYLVDACAEITDTILRALADSSAGLVDTTFVVSWGTREDGRIVEFQERFAAALDEERHGPVRRFVLEGVDHEFDRQLKAPVGPSSTFRRELVTTFASALTAR